VGVRGAVPRGGENGVGRGGRGGGTVWTGSARMWQLRAAPTVAGGARLAGTAGVAVIGEDGGGVSDAAKVM
jgi:hypothetical protein